MKSPGKIDPEYIKAFGRRLKEARQTLKMQQNDFAAKMELTGGYISEIEYGKSKPGFAFVIKVATIFKINPNWLFFGTGSMFFEKGIPGDDENLLTGLDESVIEMLKYIKKSPMFKHYVMGSALKFLHENRDTLLKDIEAAIGETLPGKD